jgi:hypothetical protein
MKTHRGDGAVWRWREVVGTTKFNGGEALRWETTMIEGSYGTRQHGEGEGKSRSVEKDS